MNSLVDEICLGEFGECMPDCSGGEQCFFVYLLCGERVVFLQNKMYKLGAGRETYQSVEALLFSRLGLGERGHWQWAYRLRVAMQPS